MNLNELMNELRDYNDFHGCYSPVYVKVGLMYLPIEKVSMDDSGLLFLELNSQRIDPNANNRP